MVEKKKDPMAALQERMEDLEERMKTIERNAVMNERWHKRDIEQLKKLLDIWTERGEGKKS